MKRISLVALMLAALPFVANAQAPATQAPAAQAAATQAVAVAPVTPVVGTFDRSTIALAYYRSPLWDAILADRRFELKAVKAGNDTARAKELEKYGGESQELAEKQVFGKAPIDNILAVLQPEFKELSGRLKLAGIVDAGSADPKAATVDVTSLLLDWLKASSETRKMAVELHQHSAGK